MNNFLLNKIDPELPDYYNVEIHYFAGNKEDHKIVWHSFVKETKIFEFVTNEDRLVVVPLSCVKKICFDSNWSKIVSIANKNKETKVKSE